MADWAAHVNVPIFLSGALQDEQTGPQWPALIDAIPKSTPVFADMVNGGHIDSTDPQTISRWLEPLTSMWPTRSRPNPTHWTHSCSTSFALGRRPPCRPRSPLPTLRFTTAPTSARRRGVEFTTQTPLVQALFDNGASSAGPGDIGSTYKRGVLHVAASGRRSRPCLSDHKGPSSNNGGHLLLGAPASRWTPSVRPSTSLPAGGNVWAANPGWDWTPVPATDGIAFQTAPFANATDGGRVRPPWALWVEAPVPVEDFQATITEVQDWPRGVRDVRLPAQHEPSRRA